MLICGIGIEKYHHEASVIDGEGRLIGKYRLGFGRLPQLPVEPINSVRRVNQRANLQRTVLLLPDHWRYLVRHAQAMDFRIRPSISPVVIPLAYIDRIFSSILPDRLVWCFLTSCGSNAPFRTRGSLISTSRRCF